MKKITSIIVIAAFLANTVLVDLGWANLLRRTSPSETRTSVARIETALAIPVDGGVWQYAPTFRSSPISEEQEIIERAGIAIRSFRHGIKKTFDIFKDLAYSGSAIDFVSLHLDESTKYLKQRLSEARSNIVGTTEVNMGKIITIGGRASKIGKLTKEEAEGFIRNMQDTLDNLHAQKIEIEKIRDEFKSTYRGDNSELLDKFNELYSYIDNAIEKLQSRIEIATAITSNLPLPINEIIDTVCALNPAITLENNLTKPIQGTENSLTLTNALSGLVTNATHFAKKRKGENAEIKVVLTKENGYVRIDVIDNGEGIPKELLKIDPETGRPKLFTLNVSQRKGGTGLGLTEAWYAITDHGGTITASSLTKEEWEKIKISGIEGLRELSGALERNPALQDHVKVAYDKVAEASTELIPLLDKALNGGLSLDSLYEISQVYNSAVLPVAKELIVEDLIPHIRQEYPELRDKPDNILREHARDIALPDASETPLVALFQDGFVGKVLTGVRSFREGNDTEYDEKMLENTRSSLEVEILEYQKLLENFRRLAKGERIAIGTKVTIRLPIARMSPATLDAPISEVELASLLGFDEGLKEIGFGMEDFRQAIEEGQPMREHLIDKFFVHNDDGSYTMKSGLTLIDLLHFSSDDFHYIFDFYRSRDMLAFFDDTIYEIWATHTSEGMAYALDKLIVDSFTFIVDEWYEIGIFDSFPLELANSPEEILSIVEKPDFVTSNSYFKQPETKKKVMHVLRTLPEHERNTFINTALEKALGYLRETRERKLSLLEESLSELEHNTAEGTVDRLNEAIQRLEKYLEENRTSPVDWKEKIDKEAEELLQVVSARSFKEKVKRVKLDGDDLEYFTSILCQVEDAIRQYFNPGHDFFGDIEVLDDTLTELMRDYSLFVRRLSGDADGRVFLDSISDFCEEFTGLIGIIMQIGMSELSERDDFDEDGFYTSPATMLPTPQPAKINWQKRLREVSPFHRHEA